MEEQKVSIDLIKLLSFTISCIALFISLKKFKTEKLRGIYDKLFDEILLIEFPNSFNNYIQIQDSENSEIFVTNIMKLKRGIGFFQFYNLYIYKDLKKIIYEIDENFEFYCSNKDSKHLAKISSYMRELYKILYGTSLIKSLKYELKSRFNW